MNRRDFLTNGFKMALVGFAVASGADTVAKLIEPTEEQRQKFAESVRLHDIIFIYDPATDEETQWVITGIDGFTNRIQVQPIQIGMKPPQDLKQAQGILISNAMPEGKKQPGIPMDRVAKEEQPEYVPFDDPEKERQRNYGREYSHYEEDLPRHPVLDLTKFDFL